MTATITTLQHQLGQCGHADTQSGDPCRQPAMFVDDRCWHHTQTDEVKPTVAEDSTDTVNVRLPTSVHARIGAHQRDAETLAGAIGRAFDALEREDPTVVEAEE